MSLSLRHVYAGFFSLLRLERRCVLHVASIASKSSGVPCKILSDKAAGSHTSCVLEYVVHVEARIRAIRMRFVHLDDICIVFRVNFIQAFAIDSVLMVGLLGPLRESIRIPQIVFDGKLLI